MARVKICGINSEAAFDAAAEAGADWVGFVFHAASPRHVTAAQAANLSRRLPAGPVRVGLFVDPTDDDLARVLDNVPLQAIQLYAPLPRIDMIQAMFDVSVWRALGIADPGDLPDRSGPETALVIEARAPAGAESPGGNATTLDWTMLAGWNPGVTWLLAGGLTPDNVARAVVESGAQAVDVSSGVERARGVKDPVLITRFLKAAHAAPHAI